MMKTRWMAVVPLALGALLVTADAQGKGQGKEQGKAQGKEQGKAQGKAQGKEQSKAQGKAQGKEQSRGESRGQAAKPAAQSRAGGKAVERGNPDRGRGHLKRTITVAEFTPAMRTYANSTRPSERWLGRAAGIAQLRGLGGDDLRLARVGNRMHLLNHDGVILLDLDDDRARNMGAWQVVTVDRDRDGSPSFCRTGAGHPVWGRQWCVDKGFGLGVEDDVRWGRATGVGDIILRPRTETDLRREVLTQVIGDIVFNRLAAHAITLGYTDPLTGRWIGETAGPRVLLLTSGDRPVAEVVDLDRDERADMLLVALRPW